MASWGLAEGYMPGNITPLTALLVTSIALSAQADSDQCMAPIYVWELTLTQVAAEAGQPDLQAIVRAIGKQAVLRGGYFDPARPDEPVRIDVTGAGGQLKVLAERSP
jgi:hypothetical protein